MSEFDELLAAIRTRSSDEKQIIFQELRESVVIHKLEADFGVRAEIILEAIRRSSDLTKRGIRGLIAELAFVIDTVPTVTDWTSELIEGDLPYDACLIQGNRRVTVQVKTQRRENGQAMKRRGEFCVEVQKTRTGEKNGEKTRPYRFNDFHLLAVCMWASTGDWHSFMYAPLSELKARKGSDTLVQVMQPVPAYPGDENDPVWTSDLNTALKRLGQ